MKKLSMILLMAASLTLSFSCSESDDPGKEPGGVGQGGEQGGEENKEPLYAVGDYYKEGFAEGIVAYVDESGEHGLLISIEETQAKWSTVHTMLTQRGGEFSMEDGQYNCDFIRSLDNWEEEYPAFAWCDAMNLLGLKAWFIPAPQEFYRIQPGLEAINATLESMDATPLATGLDEFYWTSIEVGVQNAYAYSFRDNDLASYNLDKFNEHRVRAVRKF